MSAARAVLAAAGATAALSACGGAVKPAGGRGRIVDPRTQAGRLQCLRAHHFSAAEVGVSSLQIGELPAGPTVRFLPTSGAAQADQLQGQARGAEVIGSALVYPNGASDDELKVIESCVAQGVKG